MARGDGPACDFCHSGALYLVTRDVPDAPAAHACRPHVSVAADKIAERAGGGSVTVYLLSGGNSLGDGAALVKHVQEMVRRLGAHSVKDPELALAMEGELYRAVLALIAQGAQNAAGLAAAALQSQNYEMGRETT
jgi:sirohydrochlorin ferrochelatase